MPQNTQTIDELRTRLAGLTGPARVEPLAQLAQKLFQRMMTAPLESLSARADLDEAIRATDEAYGYYRAGDPQRPQVAAFLGYLLGFRDLRVQGGNERPRAIALIEEAIAYGKFPVPYLATLRLQLAALLITNSQERLTGMASLSPIDMFAARRSPAAVPDLDRAEDLLRNLRETGGVSTDLSEMADLMLQLCELMKIMLGLGSRPIDLSAMQGIFARFADLQGRVSAGGAGIHGMMRNALEPGPGILGLSPEELPVIVLEDSAEMHANVPCDQTNALVEPQHTQDNLMGSLMDSLSLKQDAQSAWQTAAKLLQPDVKAPDLETVNTAIALASEIVEAETAELSQEDLALAHFVYAIALCLRQRADSDSDGSDYEFGAQALLSAVRTLPADHPEVPVVLRSLGAFLASDRPLAGLDALAAGFTGRFDALLATGNLPEDRKAELHALRCVCRAAFAAAELRKAVDALPADYPWPVSLKAAIQLLG